MAAEVLVTVLVCVALVVLFTLGGMSVLKRGTGNKGAMGTLGSALGGIDPATGAPSHAPGAAREEMKQRRHQAPSTGGGLDPATVYTGKISLPAPLASPESARTPQPGTQPGVHGKDKI